MKKTLIGTGLLLLLGLAFRVPAAGQENDILKLKEQIIAIQNQGELGFQDFHLCSKILGFAAYVPLSEPVLDKNGTLLIYYEPANIFTNKRDGFYEIWYTQDMILSQADGTVIKEWEDILNFHYTANKPALDLFAENSIPFEGQLPAGKYQFKAVLKDKLSGKKATHTIIFELR